MTPRFPSIALLSMIGCGPQPAAPPSTTTTPTTTTTGLPTTGAPTTGTPSVAEVCDNGIDDDGDGLLDCEDSDCYGDPACVEDCGNGTDDDGDGLIDCEDEDCWGNGCAVAWLTLTGADRATFLDHAWAQWPSSNGYCYTDNYWLIEEHSFRLHNPTGVVRFFAAGIPTSSSCTWTADAIALVADSYYGSPPDLSAPDSVSVEGLATGAGCALSPGFAFAPLDQLTLDPQVSSVQLNLDGQLWAAMSGTLTPTSVTYSTQTSTWSCSTRSFWRNEHASFPTVVGGYEAFSPL